MSDRVKALVVTLEKDIKEEDAKRFIDAIYLLKGVIKVEYVKADLIHDYATETRVRMELSKAIMDIFYPRPKG